MFRYVDITTWGQPYADGVFDWNLITGTNGMGQLPNGEPSAEEITEVVAPTPAEPVCNFREGEFVRALQMDLVDAGALPEDGVTGLFDARTCAAYEEAYGAPPTADDLVGPFAPECATVLLPECPLINRSVIVGKVALALGALGLAAAVALPKQRTRLIAAAGVSGAVGLMLLPRRA